MEQIARPKTVDFDQPFVYASMGNCVVRAETFAEAKRFFNIPGRIHLVLLLIGDDTPPMLEDFEQTIYPHGTERGALYHYRVFGWQELGWAIISVPARDEERILDFFSAYKRRLTRDAKFTARSNTGTEHFPFVGEPFRLIQREEGMLLALSKK